MFSVYPTLPALSLLQADLAQPRVVVVDDEPEIVSFILEVLQDEAIPAASCGFGAAALSCVRTRLPKVILLDIQMPGLDGIEIFKRLKSDPRTAGTFVIFVTANADRLTTWFPNYAEQGAALLRKPFDVDDLVDLVKQGLATAA